MRIAISNTHSIEKPGFFSRAILTYTLALGITFTDEELAAIEQKNIYNRVIYEPPWHPLWRIPEDDEPPCLLLHNLVEIHQAQTIAAVGYYPNDHDAAIGEGKLRKGLEDLKAAITLHRSRYEEFDL